MKITKLNYELYVIDYLERTLDASERLAFDEFLKLHPEVKEEINDYLQSPVLPEDESILMDDKQKLKKRFSLRGIYVVSLLLLMAFILVGYFGFVNPVTTSKTNSTTPSIIVPLNETNKQNDIAIANEDLNSGNLENDENQKSLNTSEVNIETIKPSHKNSKSDEKGIQKALASVVEKATFKTPQAIPNSIDKTMNKNGLSPNKLKANPLDTKNKIITSKYRAENSSQKSEPTKVLLAQIERMPVDNYAIDFNDKSSSESMAYISASMSFAKPVIRKSKKVNWKDLLTPAAYRDLDLNEAIVSKDLKKAADGIGDAIKPKSFTK